MKPFTLAAFIRGLAGFALLLGFLQVGQFLRQAGRIPLPAPVIGLALIAAALVALGWRPERAAGYAGAALGPPARLLISHLGLLFIPAGAGIVTQAGLLRGQWLPILAALLLSTWVGIAVTGWVMQRLAPPR